MIRPLCVVSKGAPYPIASQGEVVGDVVDSLLNMFRIVTRNGLNGVDRFHLRQSAAVPVAYVTERSIPTPVAP